MVNIEREITFHQKIDHPNIIRFFDYQKNEEQKKVLIALEFAENGDLFNYLNKKGALNETLACKFFVQTALALNYIHQFKMIHRDVKPENILLDKNLNAKLCDFGWSAEYDENTKRQTICGTYEYMAPEIIFKKQQDTSIDVWSLGILLYELLHNKAPYSGRSMIEVSKKIASKQIEFDREVAQDAKDLILKILKKNPKERPSIREILQDPFVRRTYGQIDDPSLGAVEKNQPQSEATQSQGNSSMPRPATSSQTDQISAKTEIKPTSDVTQSNNGADDKPNTSSTSSTINKVSFTGSVTNKRPPLGPQVLNFDRTITNQGQQSSYPSRPQVVSQSPANDQKTRTVYNASPQMTPSNQRHQEQRHFTFENPQETNYLQHYSNMNQGSAPNNQNSTRPGGVNLSGSSQPSKITYQQQPSAKVVFNLGPRKQHFENQEQKENGNSSISVHSQGSSLIQKKPLQPVDYNAQPAAQMQFVGDSNKPNDDLKPNALGPKKVADQPFAKPPAGGKETPGLKGFLGMPPMVQYQAPERVNYSFGSSVESNRSIRKQSSIDVNRDAVQQHLAPNVNVYLPATGMTTPLTK